MQAFQCPSYTLCPPVCSINYEWAGTFHLHEYLICVCPNSVKHIAINIPIVRHSHGRLPACVTDGKLGDRITPRDAEKRAGKGSRKAWKQTLLTSVDGSDVTMQKYLTMLGLEGGGGGGGATPATALRRSVDADSVVTHREGSGDPNLPLGATVPVLPAMSTMGWMTGEHAGAMQQVWGGQGMGAGA